LPLPSSLSVDRLGEIYSRTAAFYDGLVAAQQAKAKLVAIETIDRRPGERFLDLGVGTAWAFARVVEASGADRAIGLDVAPGMLAVARDALMATGLSSCPLVLGDGRTLPLADGSVDCALSTYTLEVMDLADIAATLTEMRRVLRPGGRAVIVNLTDRTDGGSEDESIIRDWKRRYQDDPEFFGGARPLQLTEMLRATGFQVISRDYVGPDWPSEVLLARK
jgi:ubiquinone/menaquinone biosynthesis C-methylase UbiE